MVELYFGELAVLDVVMAISTCFVASVVIEAAHRMSKTGAPRWASRKVVHSVMGTVIGLTIFGYSNLSGPALAVGLFFVVLMFAWAHSSNLVLELLLSGSREGETGQSTFIAAFVGLLSFAVVFILFLSRPEIFIAAILAVSWGDASGEVIGRTFGGRLVKRRFRDKTLEGSLAVFLFTALSVIVAMIVHPDVCPFCFIPQILVVAAGVSITEALCTGWRDNLLVPLVCACLVWLLIFPSAPLLWL